VKRRKVSRLFNVVKKSGNWTDYKRKLTDYNKALRQAKRESRWRHCKEIEKVPDFARLQRMGRVQLVHSSLKMENIPQQRKRPWRG
jgi:hypothetical protein